MGQELTMGSWLHMLLCCPDRANHLPHASSVFCTQTSHTHMLTHAPASFTESLLPAPVIYFQAFGKTGQQQDCCMNIAVSKYVKCFGESKWNNTWLFCYHVCHPCSLTSKSPVSVGSSWHREQCLKCMRVGSQERCWCQTKALKRRWHPTPEKCEKICRA